MKGIGKYKIALMNISVFLALVLGGIFYATHHLEEAVASISRLFLGDPIRIEKIVIQKDNISLTGISMDLEGEAFLRIPEIKATRTSFLKLGNIKIPKGDVYLIRQKDGKWNIDRYIPKEESKKIDLKDYRPITNLPIEMIELENIGTHYEDRVLEPVFHKKITWNGRVLFDKSKGISAKISGKDEEERYEIEYSGESMPYDVRVDVVGVKLDKYWKPYLKTEQLTLETGTLEAHIHSDYYGNTGAIQADIPKLEFLNKKWTAGKFYISLDRNMINVSLDYQEEGESKNTILSYDQEKKEAHVELLDFYYDKILLDLKKKQKWELGFFAEHSIYPTLEGNLQFELEENIIPFSLYSNILDLDGEYRKKENYLKLYKNKQFFLDYDIARSNLVKGEGELPFSLYDYHAKLLFQANNNIVEVQKAEITSEKNGSIFLWGKADLHKKEAEFNYRSKHFCFEKEVRGKELFAQLALKGNIFYDPNKGVKVSSKGEIERLQYDEYGIEGLRADVEYEGDEIRIYALENRFLNAKGSLDMAKQNTNLELTLRDFDNTEINLSYPKFLIRHATAHLGGNIKNPVVDIQLKEGSLCLLEKKENQIRGNFHLEEKKLSFQDIRVDENLLSGEYNISDNSYRLKANIIEEKLSDYYGFHDLYYRIIGEVELEGKGRELIAEAKSTIDKIYYRGQKLPNIAWEGSYTLGKQGIGRMEFSPVFLQSDKKKTLVSLKANVDLDRESIFVDIPEQSFQLEDIQEYSNMDFLKGKWTLAGKVSGNYRKPEYEFQMEGSQLSIKQAPLDYLTLAFHGNTEKLILDSMKTAYLQNKAEVKGYYSIQDESYDISVKAPEIDWKLLQSFASQYGVEKIEGNSNLDFHIKSDASQGSLSLHNVSLELPKKYISMKNFTGKIELHGDEMFVRRISGKINEGSAKLTGRIQVPKLNEIKKDFSFLKKLNYYFNLDIQELKYRIPEMLSLDFSSHLRLESNKLRGNIELLRGKIVDIPNAYQSYWQILRNFFEKKSSQVVLDSQSLGEDFEVQGMETKLEDLLDIDLSLWIQEGIKVDIPELNVAVEDVKGTIIGGLSLVGKEGKYALLGNLEVEKGSLMINTNIFTLDKAMLSFNENKTYLPNVNPSLLLDSNVDVNGEKVRFSIQGKTDDLRFSIASNQGNTSGSLNSLITGQIQETENNASYTALLRNIIGGQLTQTVIRPFAKIIRKIFHFEKFRITSNLYNQVNKKDDSSGDLQLGAKIEVEDNLYKDKLYWNFTGTLYDTGVQNTQINSQSKDNRIMDQYDLSLKYPYSNTKTFEMGVGKLPSKFYNSQEHVKEKKLNYHVGVKIEKKMNDFFDIFR